MLLPRAPEAYEADCRPFGDAWYNPVMVISLKPELEKLVAEKVKAGLFPSAEALVNSAVAQVVAGDDLEPGEMDALLAVGERQAREGKLVDGGEAFARLKTRR